jgi:hypothetical protein
MAQNITILGASYQAVPAVTLPKTGGGTARFDDTTDATADATVINSGATAYVNGSKVTGSQVIQVYRTGSTTPSSSLGNNGDLYLKVLHGYYSISSEYIRREQFVIRKSDRCQQYVPQHGQHNVCHVAEYT